MASASDSMGDVDSNPMLLMRWVLENQKLHPNATGDLSIILTAIAAACKAITAAVRRAGLKNLLGYAGTENVSGESQKKLDIISNVVMCNMLRSTGKIAMMVSEEEDEPIVVRENASAHYVAAFDPLDGSSNIDCNVSVGSIFALYKRNSDLIGTVATPDEILRPGRDLTVAGYAAYGSSTQLVLAMPNTGVHIFTLDPSIGEFILSHANLRIPSTPQKIYSCNEGNVYSFPPWVQAFVKECKGGPKPYSLRYVGSMVADVHRTLLYGGVFLYPATAAAPGGKLRLLYEGNPMSFIMEAAGGKADTGLGAGDAPARVLDLQPKGCHERSPILMGSARDVDRLLQLRAEGATV